MTNCNSLYITYSCSYCSNICRVTSRWYWPIDCYIDCSGVTGVIIGNAKCIIKITTPCNRRCFRRNIRSSGVHLVIENAIQVTFNLDNRITCNVCYCSVISYIGRACCRCLSIRCVIDSINSKRGWQFVSTCLISNIFCCLRNRVGSRRNSDTARTRHSSKTIACSNCYRVKASVLHWRDYSRVDFTCCCSWVSWVCSVCSFSVPDSNSRGISVGVCHCDLICQRCC